MRVNKTILVAEDDEQDAELILAALQQHQLGHLVVVVHDGEQALDYLYRRGEFAARPEGNPSLVLLDLGMPQLDGLEFLKIMKADAKLNIIPVVVLSASNEQRNLVECYRHGVNAFVVKPLDFGDFGKAVAQLGAFWTAINVPSPLPSEANGYSPAEAQCENLHILHLEDDPVDGALVSKALEAGGISCRIVRVENRRDFVSALEFGDIQLVLSNSSVAFFEGLEALALVRAGWPELPFILVAETLGEELAMDSRQFEATDYVFKGHLNRLGPAVQRAMQEVESRSARASLEARFIEAQKMDVVGQLAGGVAHDFNNILAVVMGFSELLEMELAPDSPLRSYTEEVRQAAELGAGLTKQLLIFSRKQTVKPVILDLNDVIQNLDKLLRRLIEENIEMTFVAGQDLGSIKADPGYLAQLLMNLAVNARDAMPQGGRLTIETSHGPHPAGVPGRFVILTVSDTGCGLNDEVKQRLFEPFFTTKAEGKGTGLGLATCQTILRQCHATITVASELGTGTSFVMYFPRAGEPIIPQIPAVPADQALTGTETLLLVEDEGALRSMAQNALRKQGYEVLSAANGREALQVARDWRGEPIQLVVTDVVMPRMGGKIMAEWLQLTHPELKFLFTSGYTDDAIAQDGLLEPGAAFLPKPYTPATLSRKVRELLDGTTA